MIGIKVQNLLWEKTLLNLLKDQAEKYHENHIYNIIISETKDNKYPTLILGKDISLPFSFDTLKEKISQIQTPEFENKEVDENAVVVTPKKFVASNKKADDVGLGSRVIIFAFYFPVLIFSSEHVLFYITGKQ